jgi:hypothetical protein
MPIRRAMRNVKVMGCKKNTSDGAKAAPIGNDIAAV